MKLGKMEYILTNDEMEKIVEEHLRRFMFNGFKLDGLNVDMGNGRKIAPFGFSISIIPDEDPEPDDVWGKVKKWAEENADNTINGKLFGLDEIPEVVRKSEHAIFGRLLMWSPGLDDAGVDIQDEPEKNLFMCICGRILYPDSNYPYVFKCANGHRHTLDYLLHLCGNQKKRNVIPFREKKCGFCVSYRGWEEHGELFWDCRTRARNPKGFDFAERFDEFDDKSGIMYAAECPFYRTVEDVERDAE